MVNSSPERSSRSAGNAPHARLRASYNGGRSSSALHAAFPAIGRIGTVAFMTSYGLRAFRSRGSGNNGCRATDWDHPGGLSRCPGNHKGKTPADERLWRASSHRFLAMGRTVGRAKSSPWLAFTRALRRKLVPLNDFASRRLRRVVRGTTPTGRRLRELPPAALTNSMFSCDMASHPLQL
jgi:hypothetical protein